MMDTTIRMLRSPARPAWLWAALLGMLLAAASTALQAQDGTGEAAAPAGQPPVAGEISSGDSELRQAYRKEFAFLAAQKRDLEQRLANFQDQARQELSRTEAKIDRLQDEVLNLESRVEDVQDRTQEVKQLHETAQRNVDVLRATFQQAAVTFTEHERNIVDAEGFNDLPENQRLQQVFSGGFALLDQLESVHREPGEFYSIAGDKIEGEIVHFGAVASYGVADGSAGILVPAGGGEMKLWTDPNPETARALASGTMPAVLPLFLHGSSTAAVDTGGEGGVIETIQSGGTIAWLIVALAGVALILILARVFYLKRASSNTGALIDEVSEQVRADKIDKALETCSSRKGSAAAVVGTALRNLHRERGALDDTINESILHESSRLERFGTMILVIAAVSPLLGLLGTVTGMIATFEVITEHGTGDPQLLSGGISVALITTELGLIVAIPTLLIGNMLSGWAERVKDDMHKAALRVINLYEHSILENARKAA